MKGRKEGEKPERQQPIRTQPKLRSYRRNNGTAKQNSEPKSQNGQARAKRQKRGISRQRPTTANTRGRNPHPSYNTVTWTKPPEQDYANGTDQRGQKQLGPQHPTIGSKRAKQDEHTNTTKTQYDNKQGTANRTIWREQMSNRAAPSFAQYNNMNSLLMNL